MKYSVLVITDRSDLPETELFIRLKKSGVDLELACNPTGRYHERIERTGIVYHELIVKSRFSLAGIRKIRKILAHKRYDIIYCFNNKAISNLILSLSGKEAKVITYRGIVGNIEFFSPASWTTHLNPRVKRIVCVCKAVRNYLDKLQWLGLRLRPGRAVAIYKGHDLGWYQAEHADLAEFGITKEDFVVTFAGRNRPRKGAHVIIEAAKLIPREIPVHFILMGRISENRQLMRQIAANPNKDRIHLAGFRNDAPEVIAASDTFVMPSTEREGLCRAVIEAMAYGVPPIVTRVGGLPELVKDNESGFVIEPNDPEALAEKIIAFYQDPKTKKMLGENARQRIDSHFNIDTTVEKTQQLFEELVRL